MQPDLPMLPFDVRGYSAVLSAEYGQLELEPEDSAEPFMGRFSAVDLGSMRVFATVTNKSHFIRQRHNRAIVKGGRFILTLLEAGAFELRQNSGVNQCRTDQIVLLDSEGSFETCQYGAARTLSISIPKPLVRSRFQAVDRICGQSLSTESGFCSILHQLMVAVEHQIGNLDQRQIPLLTSSLVDMMEAAYSEAYISETYSHPGNSHQLSRILTVINENYWDANLTPSAIAARLKLSRSYVCAVVAHSGTTINKIIKQKRLHEAGRLLTRPQTRRSITAIALGTGFQSVSHFSRCFTEHYGEAPLKYRKRFNSDLISGSCEQIENTLEMYPGTSLD